MSQSRTLQRPIVEFIHPGREFRPRRPESGARLVRKDDISGIRCWNNERNHERNFLISKGMCRESESSQDIESLLTFWGEWEPQSRFTKLENPPPYYVHTPFLIRGSGGKHNTDPFVFGTNFWFTNCLQPTYRRLLVTLSVGSLIIFGTWSRSREKARVFKLDTVFVVGERFTPKDYDEQPAMWPEQLRQATLDKLNNDSLVYYRGKAPNEGMPFSFVPCRRANSAASTRGHERVCLDYQKFGLSVLQGCGRFQKKSDVPNDDILEFWNKIVVECRDQGFCLGHSIELPPIESARGCKALHQLETCVK